MLPRDPCYCRWACLGESDSVSVLLTCLAKVVHFAALLVLHSGLQRTHAPDADIAEIKFEHFRPRADLQRACRLKLEMLSIGSTLAG